MKVLFCSYQAVANPGGGVFTQVMMTKKYLLQEGVEVELFDNWKRYNWSEINVIHAFETDMRNFYLIKMFPADIPLVVSPIIDKTYHPLVARTLASASSLLPLPILTSYKSHDLAFRKADIIISRSADEDRMLTKGFGVSIDRIRRIHNGVESLYLQADPTMFKKKYGLTDFILYVGQIGNKRKNLLSLLNVAKIFRDIPFVLIGPILETSDAQNVLAMAAEIDNVHVLGRIPRDELVSAYAACEVFVLPSLVEGTGLVALEAGLAGAKVVVTRYGGPPDYFDEGGFLIEPTVDGIRQGIEVAMNSPRNGRLREHIIKNFLWSKVVGKLANIYKEILD